MKIAAELTESRLVDTKKARATLVYPIDIRYAYADQNYRTWFISHNKHCPIKGTKLLLILTCQPTPEPVYTPKSYPTVGTVLTDKRGAKLKVVEVKWYVPKTTKTPI